jgi:uncharacterized protein (DUF1778 family)
MSAHTATSQFASKSRDSRLDVRASSDQKRLFQHAAALSGRSLSEFLLDSAQESAVRIVREHEVVRLSREEQIAFVSALLDPPEPGPRLARAVADYPRKAAD